MLPVPVPIVPVGGFYSSVFDGEVVVVAVAAVAVAVVAVVARRDQKRQDQEEPGHYSVCHMLRVRKCGPINL